METINWNAYNEGFNKCIEVENDTKKGINPYTKNSSDWKDWNRGWNAYNL